MKAYSINLEETDIASIQRLAKKYDLKPGIYARILLLRSLREEMRKFESGDKADLSSLIPKEM
jgi:hypothetical protein